MTVTGEALCRHETLGDGREQRAARFTLVSAIAEATPTQVGVEFAKARFHRMPCEVL